MLKAFSGVVLAVTLAVSAACGSSSASPTDATPAGLRATAIAWSKAFLTGTVTDIESLESTNCRTSPKPSVAARYLRGMRAGLEHYLGTPLGSIRIVRVQVRNVTATGGEAEVQYDLPEAKTGNDNWVGYTYQDGQWRVADCRAPIGGESAGASASSP